MTHNWLRFLVPYEWTGDQALAAAGLFQQAIDAIWVVHGEEMAVALGELGPGSPQWDEVLRPESEDFDDDIPF